MLRSLILAFLGLSILLTDTLGLPSFFNDISRAREEASNFFNVIYESINKNPVTYLLKREATNYDHTLPDDAPECLGCVSGVLLVQYYIMRNRTTPNIIETLSRLCVALNYGNPVFCEEYTNLIGDTIITILKNTKNTAREVCSFMHNIACGNGDVVGHRWSLPLPDGKPPVNPRQPPKANTPKLRVLHITDTHYDQFYKEGTRDVCDMWMCCREENGMATEGESAAGKWGGWKCDIPERTFVNFLEHANKTHGKFDYILWTGDIPAHATWKQTKEESLFMLRSTTEKILEYFPNTPIFPALGNHEASPPNLYPSPSLGRPEINSWLYEELTKQWGQMLPQDSLKTVEYGGFYVSSVTPGLKIISLNTNFCYSSNWWLILNSTDPANMLSWFMEELLKAESENAKVHVIAHIPPGYVDCLKIWGRNFYNIISRFENTVTAQFYGHTHADEIEIYYDSETKMRPVSVGYVAPSVTTFVDYNPSYRIYTIDGDHQDSAYDVYDFETWVMDLEKSNKEGPAFWRKEYEAKEAYNMKSLLPEDWDDFYERLKIDKDLLELYDRHYWHDSPRRPPCDYECKRSHLFDIRSGVQYGPPIFQ